MKEEPPTDETVDKGIHIGKNSAGWVFHFQAHPFAGNLKEMKEVTQGGTIYNEYLKDLTYEDFWSMVERTKKLFNGRKPYILMDPEYPQDKSFDSYEESGFAWTPVEFS